MAFRQVRPGLYERTDAPKKVKISPELAEAVLQGGHSTLLRQIVEQAVRDSDQPEHVRE